MHIHTFKHSVTGVLMSVGAFFFFFFFLTIKINLNYVTCFIDVIEYEKYF